MLIFPLIHLLNCLDQLGDQLIQVNGKRVDQASYDQVIAWIRQTRTNEEISLHVKNSPRIPVQEKSGDPIEWLEVETIRMQATDGPNFGTSSSGKSGSNMSHSSSGDEGIESCGSHRSGEWEDTKTGRNEDQVQIGIRGQSEVADRESVEVNKQKVSVSSSQSGGSSICDTDSVSVSGLSGSSLESSAASSNFQFIPNIPETFIRVPGKRAARESHDESPFGCGVVRGPDEWPGLYVQTVRAKSLADRVGLEVGDQILEIQDKSIDGLPFETAVKLIKRLQAEQDELRLKVRKGAALRYLDYNRRLRMQAPVSQDRMTSNRCIQLGLGVNQAESVSKVEEHATDGLDSEDDLSPLGSPVENVSLDSKVSSSDANETLAKLMGQMNSISGIENQSSDKESRTLRLKDRKELNFHNETVRISPVKLSLDGEPKPRKLLNGLNGARRVGESRESRFSYVSGEQKQASDRNQTDSRRHPGKETDIIIEYEEENQRDTNQLVWFGTKTTPRRDQEDEPIERHEMESPKIRIVSQNCKLHNHKQAAQRVKVANLLHELQPRSQLAQLAANHIEASSKTRPQRVVRDTRDKPQVAICEPRNRIYAAVSSMRRPSQMMQRYVSMDNLLFNQTGLRCLKRNVRQPYEQIYACSAAFPPQNSLVMIASQTPPTPGVRKLDSGGYQATGACCAVGAHRLCSPAARNSNPARRKQPNEAFVCHTTTPNVPSPAVRLSKARSVDKLNVEALGCSMSLAASKNRVNYIRINQLDSSKSLKHLKSRSQLTPDSQRLQYESVPSPSTVCRSVGCQSDYHDPSELVYIQKSQNGTSCSICLAQAAALNPARVEKILHLRPNNLGLSGRNLISNGIRPEFYSQENRSKLSKPSKCNSSCCSLYSADQKVRPGEMRYRDRSKPAELQVLRSPDMKISSQRECHLSTFMGVSNKSTRYQSAGSEELSPICTPPPLTSTSDESINCHSVSSNSSPSILSDCEAIEPPKRTYLRSRVAPSSSKRVEKSCRKPSPPCPPPPPARDLELERKSQRELRGSNETQEKETSKPNHRLCFVDELKILANQQKSSSSQPSKGSTSPELESSTLIKMINASKSTSSGWTKRVSSCAYCTKSNAGKLDGKPASNKANVLVDGGASSNKCSKCNKSQALMTPPLDSDPGKLKKEGEADKRRQHGKSRLESFKTREIFLSISVGYSN